MLTEKLIIVGAGGHSKVVISSVLQSDSVSWKLTVVDDDVRRDGELFCGQQISTPVRRVLQAETAFHVAVGNNEMREQLYNIGLSCDSTPLSVMNPRACVAPEAEISAAVFAAAGSVIAPHAQIGVGAIINHGAVVDHDCVVGAFAHIGPNATLGGGVVVGNRAMIGAGANILPAIRIGDGAIVAAGAVVVSDVEPGATVIGVPAKIRRGSQCD